MQKLWLILAFIILCLCIPSCNVEDRVVRDVVQFQNVPVPEMTELLPYSTSITSVLEKQFNETTFELFISRMYSIDSGLIFLAGVFRSPSAVFRSVLLRSDNGGKSWQEVMQPGYGGSVFFLTFNNDFGLAILAWNIEAVGSLQFFGTIDYGNNWEHLGEFEHIWGRPLGLKVEDELNWQITMLYETGFSDSRVAILRTKDGGSSWEEIKNTFFGDFDGSQEEAIELYAPKEVDQPGIQWGFGCSDNLCSATGRDGSEWRVYSGDSASWIIQQWSAINQDWETYSILQRKYRYVDGEMSAITNVVER